MNLIKIHDDLEIASRIQEIGAALTKRFTGEDLLFIGILKGASILTADLLRAISFPCHYDFIQEMKSLEAISKISFIGGGWQNYNGIVFLLKDVIHSGIIENYLVTQFKENGAKDVHIISIIDRPQERKVDIEPIYSLFVENEGIFAGYGMEYKQKYGNLSYIVRVEEK
jgi:hypoxanthine phosphoribosyltransferase